MGLSEEYQEMKRKRNRELDEYHELCNMKYGSE